MFFGENILCEAVHFMEHINDSLMETYLFESNSLIQRLDELLLEAESKNDFSSDDVNEIFRSMHTIKGSSAMMEFQPLMEISHHIEDLFFEIRENGIEMLSSDLKSELFNLLFKCVDRLREDLEKVEQGIQLDMNIGEFIEDINGFLAKMKPGSAPAASSATNGGEVEELSEHSLPNIDMPYFLHVLFDEDCGMENIRAFMIVNSLNESELTFQTHPADTDTNPNAKEEIAANGLYLAFNTEEDAAEAMSTVANASNVRSYEVIFNPVYVEMAENTTLGGDAPAPKEAPVVEMAKPEPTKEEKAENANNISKQIKTLNQTKQSLISVNISKLDSLMAIVGEIVITQSMVTASPELQGIKLDSFLKSSRQLRKLTDDLQDIAMSLRMVPISSVFQKMNRIVRDMAKTLNKDVKLEIIGEDTEVDKSIVDAIGDPIMHLVRNAMDHGIEPNVEERIAAGKPAQGEIILAAKNTGNEVIVTVENDGRDMNTEAILAKASKKGLLTKPEEEYTKKEILSLLMMPGFSTNANVTEYSGRGVGLDVVKKNIEAIGGTVSIANDPGRTLFTLKIPLTLSIVGGMEIAVGESIFTIPISNIKQSFKATTEQIVYDATGNEIILCMGEFCPVIRLNKLYNIEGGTDVIEEGILIWVETNDRSYCLFVDQLLGEQQVVVKPMPSYLNNFNIKQSGISGCTVLGNGNISIILDVDNILSAALGRD